MTERLALFGHLVKFTERVWNPKETVAAHSYRMALLAVGGWMEGKSKGLDLTKIMIMCLIHDIAEGVTGDLPPDRLPSGVKTQMERVVVGHIFDGRPELLLLWEEYEKRESPEAILVKDLDILELILSLEESSGVAKINPENGLLSGIKNKWVMDLALKAIKGNLMLERRFKGGRRGVSKL